MGLDLTKMMELWALCDKTDGGARPAVSDGSAVDFVTGETIPADTPVTEYYNAAGDVYATCAKPVADMIKTEGEIIPAGTIVNGTTLGDDYAVGEGEEWLYDGDEACEKNPQTVFKGGMTLPPRMLGTVDVTLDDGTVVTLGAGDPIPANATESDIVVGLQGNATCVTKYDWNCHRIPATEFADFEAPGALLIAEAEAYADANPNLGPMYNDPVTGLTIVRDDNGGYCCINQPVLDIECTYMEGVEDVFNPDTRTEDYDVDTGSGTVPVLSGDIIRYRFTNHVDTRIVDGVGLSVNWNALLNDPDAVGCLEFWTESGDVNLCSIDGCSEKYALSIPIVSINEPHTLTIDTSGIGNGPASGIIDQINGAAPQDPAVGLSWNISGNVYQLVGSTVPGAPAPAPDIRVITDDCKETYNIKFTITGAFDELGGADWWSILPRLIRYKPVVRKIGKDGTIVSQRTCGDEGNIIDTNQTGPLTLSDWE